MHIHYNNDQKSYLSGYLDNRCHMADMKKKKNIFNTFKYGIFLIFFTLNVLS